MLVGNKMDVSDVIFGLCLVILRIKPSLEVTLTTIACSSDSVCTQTDDNAICNNLAGSVNGYCKCDTNYKDDPSQTSCVLRVLNRPCVEHNDCQQHGEFVECTDNVCACKPGYSDYVGNDICDKVIGKDCISDSGCTVYLADTTCFLVSGVFNCSCTRTHVEEDHVCKIKLGGTCSSDDDCLELAECKLKTGTCQCTDGHKKSGEYCTAGSQGIRYSLHTCAWLLALLIVLRYGTR